MAIFEKVLVCCGWAEYQAACLAPFLASILALVVFGWGVGVVYDIICQHEMNKKRGYRK